MTEQREVRLAGGCQCGAVRYAVHGEIFGVHICHCRMCQKQFGGPFAPLFNVRHEDYSWTRGEPSLFASSPNTRRGFCSACGTPLLVYDLDSAHVNVAIGSLDDPEAARPELQIGIESRMSWFADLVNLREMSTEEAIPAERLAGIKNFQHPDHDTQEWPPASD